ncbi:7294_t:CDS:2 [Gigaspora margarita]|uniref:7294_t:CDS:1 n=1 Tax=Gigaspora margarita TaxID=4874 RepID=A0ABN7V795_GIGMA|nr:7294_t:CDS:2 [Gigaspora margarita]
MNTLFLKLYYRQKSTYLTSEQIETIRSLKDKIPNSNSIPLNTNDSTKKISGEDLDALYKKEAKKDKKNKANMTRQLATT